MMADRFRSGDDAYDSKPLIDGALCADIGNHYDFAQLELSMIFSLGVAAS